MWNNKENDKVKLLKDFGCFLGSFWNPEAARKIQSKEDTTSVEVNEDEFDKAGEYLEKVMQQEAEALEKKGGKRRYKKKISVNNRK